MICNGCGNQEAYRVRVSADGELCNGCGLTSSVTIHDVYFKGPYLDPHLVNTTKIEQKDGVWVRSRAHKAQLMRELNVHESGDRVRGTRNFDPSLSRRVREQ